ncbi:MAG: hypothetical protein QOG46_1625 [Pseudonocardiales bacterium]|nr:hypothetical protein [Pseudonocardiales bacterium]
MKLNDDSASCRGTQRHHERPQLNGVVAHVVAYHDIGYASLRRGVRPRAMHAAVRDATLGTGPLKGTQHVLRVIHPGQVGHLRRQRKSSGPGPAPDIEHGTAAWSK